MITKKKYFALKKELFKICKGIDKATVKAGESVLVLEVALGEYEQDIKKEEKEKAKFNAFLNRYKKQMFYVDWGEK